jgi:excisionase family DNA binding protein
VQDDTSARKTAPVPRLALSVEEACAALGCGWDFWQAHIAPELRIVRRGRKKLVPVRELERWLEQAAHRVLE